MKLYEGEVREGTIARVLSYHPNNPSNEVFIGELELEIDGSGSKAVFTSSWTADGTRNSDVSGQADLSSEAINQIIDQNPKVDITTIDGEYLTLDGFSETLAEDIAELLENLGLDWEEGFLVSDSKWNWEIHKLEPTALHMGTYFREELDRQYWISKGGVVQLPTDMHPKIDRSVDSWQFYKIRYIF